MQSVRFLMVSVVGVALDIALGWALATRLDLPLWLAGALGFATAALLNYLLHERWTFWGGRNRRSLGRFGRYLMSLGLTAVVRLLAILGFEWLLGADRGALAVLLPSVALSFCASFLLARSWVFAEPADQRGGQ